jgi:hypothetical protein
MADIGFEGARDVQNVGIMQSETKKISGWLTWLTFLLIVVRPLILLSVLGGLNIQEFNRDPTVSLDGWGTYKTLIWLLSISAAVLSIYAGFGLWKGRTRHMVQRAIGALWIAGPVFTLLQLIAIFVVFSGNAEPPQQLLKSLIGNVFFAGVWTAYLLRSTQVKGLYSRVSAKAMIT